MYMLLWCILAGLQLIEVTSPAGISEGLTGSINAVANIGLDMVKADRLRSSGKSKSAMGRKFSTLKKKAKKFDEDAHETTAGAVEGVGGGLTNLVTGIKSGSWQDIATGGLEILTSLTDILPVPEKLAAILGIVSLCFSLFGGSTGGEESTEGMMKRVVTEALNKAHADYLRSEINGAKKKYGSLSNSIKNFRETGRVSREQSNKFYTQAFEGIEMLGRVEYHVDKWCDVGSDVNTKDEDGDEVATKVEKLNEKADKCLEFLNLYCDLSLLRQLLVADLSSLLAELNKKTESENALKLIINEQKADKSMLRFLVDPINSPDKRYIINRYYGSPEKYPTIQAYIANLDKIKSENTMRRSIIPLNKTTSSATTRTVESSGSHNFIKQGVVICSERTLKGSCLELTEEGMLDYPMKGWSDAIYSIYVSAGFMMTAWADKNGTGSTFGPFIGPTVYGRVKGSNQITSLKIEQTSTDADHLLRICSEKNLEQTAECDMLEFGEYPDLSQINTGVISTKEGNANWAQCKFPFIYEEKSYDKCLDWKGEYFWCATTSNYDDDEIWGKCIFGRNWDNKIKSIAIPAGMKVTAYDQKNYGGTKTWGPFYGPDVFNSVCYLNKWSSMKIERTDKLSTQMITICRGENYLGFCDKIDTPTGPAGEVKEVGRMHELKSCNWDHKDWKMRSMKIPGGFSVELFSGTGFTQTAYGPYQGPISVGLIDGASGNDFIRSLRITKDI